MTELLKTFGNADKVRGKFSRKPGEFPMENAADGSLITQLNHLAQEYGCKTHEVLTLVIAAGIQPTRVGNTRVLTQEQTREFVPFLEQFAKNRSLMRGIS